MKRPFGTPSPLRARSIYWGTQVLAWALLVLVIALSIYEVRDINSDQHFFSEALLYCYTPGYRH
ncbi:MAG TPA: hypothetical protein PL070_14575, partial [Flavobacteriales bacterium]|nr:hypothetical protein [Flavobacteriales bacterium]